MLETPDHGGPGPDWNLVKGFQAGFRRDPARPALHLPDGRSLPYDWLDRESARAAAWLASQGLRPGDRVTVQAPKCPPWLTLYLGCLRGGFVLQPLNPTYTPRELAWFIRDAAPRLLICAPGDEELFGSLAGDRDIPVHTLGPDDSGTLPAAWSDLPDHFPPVRRQRDDLAVLLYSSGTTGTPKGAMLSHGNLLSNARTLVSHWGFSPGDRLLHALPIYHAHGLFVAVGCALLSGASMVFLPRFGTRDVLRWLPHCTVMMGVPTFYTRLLGQPGFGPELTRQVRLFISGSAPLPPTTFAEFEGRTGQRILERYGLTETGMNCSNPLLGERRPGSVGPALPGVEVRTVNGAGEPVPAGTVGEVEVRGPNVCQGYWHRPAESAAAFTPDGWFRTGDLGVLAPDGYLTLAGRSKDLIISGGLNVYPGEVESVLDTLPGVVESAVIGIPHPDFGEAVVAVVVPAPGTVPVAADLLAVARRELAAYKVPKQIFFAPELPRNAMGKVRKNILRERFAQTPVAPEASR